MSEELIVRAEDLEVGDLIDGRYRVVDGERLDSTVWVKLETEAPMLETKMFGAGKKLTVQRIRPTRKV